MAKDHHLAPVESSIAELLTGQLTFQWDNSGEESPRKVTAVLTQNTLIYSVKMLFTRNLRAAGHAGADVQFCTADGNDDWENGRIPHCS